MRNQIDYVFLCREPIVSNRKRLYESYAGIIPSFAEFNAIMDTITEDYRCVVIKKRSLSNKVEECVSWYRAEQHSKFVMGSKAYWQKHYERYDAMWDEARDDDEEDTRVDFVREKRAKGSRRRAKYTAKVRMVGM